MSVSTRSLRSAGRPVFGRPAYAVVVALTVTFAVGAPAAFAEDPVDPVVAEAPAAPPQQPAPGPAVDPPAGEDPPAAEQSPVEGPPAAEGPPAGAEPPAQGPPSAGPPATHGPPSAGPPSAGAPPSIGPPAAEGPPLGSAEREPSAARPPSASPPDRPSGADGGSPQTGDGRSVAQNVSRVIQAVWQVQQGCRAYCYGTSQSQVSVQQSHTSQSATAVSGGGSTTAQARNEAGTIQFVWQMQIGCVAFCFDTTQTQEASQAAHTSQLADAQSALMAWADNLAQTVQYVFQTQRGCERECHGASQSQTVSQQQSTSQTSTATAQAGDGVPMLPAWLIALAENLGATIQTSYQYQEAVCLEHCTGDAQVQEAVQRAETDQRAVALVLPPPAPAGGTPAGEPPSDEPPAEPGTATVADPAGVPPAAGPFAALARRVPATLGRKGPRKSRRREIVMRATTHAESSLERSTSPARAALAAVTVQSTAITTARSEPPRRKRQDTGAQPERDRLPATTLAVPPADPGGSSLWLLLALLAAPIAGIAALLGTRLASNLQRI